MLQQQQLHYRLKLHNSAVNFQFSQSNEYFNKNMKNRKTHTAFAFQHLTLRQSLKLCMACCCWSYRNIVFSSRSRDVASWQILCYSTLLATTKTALEKLLSKLKYIGKHTRTTVTTVSISRKMQLAFATHVCTSAAVDLVYSYFNQHYF